MKELIDRLKSESPEFFKKLQWIAGVLVLLLGTLQTLLSFGLFPELVQYMPVITNIIIGSATAFGVSTLPKKDVVGGGSRPDTRP